jgi:hypothetical protein
MLACRKHWHSLPKAIQDAIWREYRTGQEIDKRPSLRYLAVQRLACSKLAFRPYDSGAAKLSGQLLVEALDYRRQAMGEGGSDPLAGLLEVQ